MGKKLIISNLGQEATNTAITALSVGKVGIVVAGTDFTTITPSKSDLIHIMANYAADRKDITPTFTLNDIKYIKKLTYSPGTKQSQTITPVPAVGHVQYSIKIINTTSGQASLPTATFSVPYETNITAATIVNNFVAAINKRNKEVDLGIVASIYSNKLKLEAESSFNTFTTFLNDDLEGATVSNVPGVVEVGTPKWLARIENEFLSYGEGHWNRVLFPTIPVSNVNNAKTYNLLVLEIAMPRKDHSGTRQWTDEQEILYIAEDSTFTNTTSGKPSIIETIISLV